MAEQEFTTNDLTGKIRRVKDGRQVEPRQCLSCKQLFYSPCSPSRKGRQKYCSRSCGIRETSKRHGHSTHTTRSPTYSSWASMRERCDRPSATKFSTYGAVGITYQESWKQFKHFLADMGERPPGTTLDRRDNSKGYSKDNCRWATPKQQQRNMRSNHLITYNGVTQCAAAWAEVTGVRAPLIVQRIKRGLSVEQALTIPVKKGTNYWLFKRLLSR